MQDHSLHKLRNVFHSALLVLGMGGVAAGCAWTMWGAEGVVWTLATVVVILWVAPSLPPELVLSVYRARPVRPADLPRAYAILNELCRRAGLPVLPRLYYVPSAVANAFAVGSASAPAIAVTDGMLRTFTMREFAGVLAHEVSHIANNDLWIMRLADAMGRVTIVLSGMGGALLVLNLPLTSSGIIAVPLPLVLLLILAPSLIQLLQLALSRAREFDADLDAARLLGDATPLASALLKLERQEARFWDSLFWPGARVPPLLRSHPPTEQRLERLLALRGPASVASSYPETGLAHLPHVLRQRRTAPSSWRRPRLRY